MPPKSTQASAEDWVHGSHAANELPRTVATAAPPEAMKRFTIDVPLELHRRIKTQCAMHGKKMADVLREILEREFPES
jgi:ParG